MGILSSKTLESMLEESEATAGKVSSPEHLRTLALDPRSPSDEIARTPILVEQSPSSEKPRDFGAEDNFVKLTRTPLSSANSRANKKVSLSQRILSKFSQPQNFAAESERRDENDVPVQLLQFELSDSSEVAASAPNGKMHRV